MDLKQLEAFVYVVKLNSFSKAADRAFLSQPTISAHIISLERELGTQLLVRSTKEVFPTKAGLELYHQAVNILALRDQAVHTTKGYCNDSRGEIHVISSSVPAQYLLPEAIAGFHKQFPNILVHVTQSDSGHVGELLKGCHYDFGIVGTQPTSNRFLQQPFYKDMLVLAYPASMEIDEASARHNLASFIREHPFVLREDGSGTLNELEKFLEKCGLSLNDLKPAGYFNNTQGVVHAVASGLGISFVSKAAVSLYVKAGAVKTFEIDMDYFYRTFLILYKRDVVLSPVQRLLQQFLQGYYEHFHAGVT